MDARTDTLERRWYAVIGIAVILAFVQIVVLAPTGGDPSRWLMLGVPIAMIVSAITRLRRIHSTGRADGRLGTRT